MDDPNDVAAHIVDESYRIHVALGPGLLESVYETILEKGLIRRGLKVERQKPVALEFDGITFDESFRVDLIVEGIVVVELKSVEVVMPVHKKKLLTYLKLLNLQLGFVVNFGAALIKDGIHRVVNGLESDPLAGHTRSREGAKAEETRSRES